MKSLFALILLILILGLGSFTLRYLNTNKAGGAITSTSTSISTSASSTNEVACTMEAKLCPDGSYVSRTGPNCEFATCPAAINSGIQGKVLLGPTCPVERIPPEPQCADKLFQTNLALTTLNGAQIVKLFSSDASGAFRVSVAPGTYLVRSAPGSPVMPTCSKSEPVVVKPGFFTEMIIQCDSGIR